MIKEFVGTKLVWIMTLVVGSVTFTLSPEEWRILLTCLASLIVGLGGGSAYRWHMRDLKRRRMNGEPGKGEKCKEEKD